jgi:gluconokinase
MGQAKEVRSIVVMGVSGSGKSAIGRLLAEAINSEFSDGDRLHSADNIARMSVGHALCDTERLPWLHAVGQRLEGAVSRHQDSVVACSALKRIYRDILREHVPDIFFVFLDGPLEVVHERVIARNHEFMPPSLLSSQFASLEPLEGDERGIRIDIRLEPEEIVSQIETELRRLPAGTELREKKRIERRDR